MMRSVKKRDGNVVVFDKNRIVEAIYKAATSVGGSDRELAEALAEEVITTCEKEKDIPSVELIQDTIEKILIKHGHAKTAKAFILYRAEKERLRAGSVAPPKIDPEDPLLDMFEHQSKLRTLIPDRYVKAYQRLYFTLQRKIAEGSLPTHPDNDYVGGNELARDIFEKKYYVRNLKNDPVETRPEHVFKRLAAFLGSLEESPLRQDEAAERYYKMMYQGYFMPGGRVIAGAGDLYRVKTLANCFVTQIEGDNIESIYNAAYDCARTYSYGGGIGVDISSLRPKDAVVHNAANKSTGAVSFMELFSLTTGLIGQSGRRGALMLTLDVKHPDIYRFINVKKVPNWVTNQIVEQCKWSNTFSEEQLREIEKQVMENTQVRFANISIKTNDEFMQAVEEQTKYGPEMILIYEKEKKPYPETAQSKENHYSFGIPSKDILDYRLIKKCGTIAELKRYLNEEYEISLPESALDSTSQRDVFGDYVIERDDIDLAIRRAGDFLLYFNSKQTGEIKRLVKARDVWNQFIAGNYKTAEPGIIFWSTMKAYSPSNYVGRPILSTNPCGEVPLEDGGACNLGSLNLSRFVVNGYKETAEIDWKLLKEASYDAVRFLDSVVQWNELLNPLEKQKKAARETRRTGLGVMGIADMLNQLGMGYDSDEAIRIVEKIMRTIANHAYRASANLAVEKGPSPLFTYDAYSKNKFFIEALDEETKEIIKEKGLRNIAILSIAPTGTISNVALGFVNGTKHYVGVSGGIEPIFALYYTRRSESFGNKLFNVFHATVQAYLDMVGKSEEAKDASDENLRTLLPDVFFRTAHHIDPESRVNIQGTAQRFIDHSISSTLNLPESIDPETISNIYLKAWKKGLKGVTIYRDGSRYPILSVQSQQTKFQDYKNRIYLVKMNGDEQEMNGDEVFALPDGRLTTPFHALEQHLPHVIVTLKRPDLPKKGEKEVILEEKTHTIVREEKKGSNKVCKIEYVNGQLVKSCGD